MPDVNIKDVAARAGVSVGTVSNVLNRPTAVRPRPSRVEATIRELGFVPNASARQLRGQSRTIAYVVLDASNPFFTDVARGIEEVSREEGLSLFICNSDRRGPRGRISRTPDGTARGRRPDHCLGLRQPPPTHAPSSRSTGRPGGPAPDDSDDWCTVGVDDVAGGEMAIDHLLEQGHCRLAFVGGPTGVPQLADRRYGTQRSVAKAGLDADALLYIETAAPTIREGRRAGERLLGLTRRNRPTGVLRK